MAPSSLLAVASVLLVKVFHAGTSSPASTEPRSYCQFDSFRAQCTNDEVILMDTAQYGRMRTGKCISGAGYIGCASDVVSYMDTLCSGKRACVVSVTSLADIVQPCKRDFTSYLEASYKCIKVETADPDVCLTKKHIALTRPSGYLAGIVTTDLELGTIKCPWLIKAKSGQRISLELSVFGPLGTHSSEEPAEDSEDDGFLGRGRACPWNAVVEEKTTFTQESLCRQGRRKKQFFTSETNEIQVYFVLQGERKKAPAFTIRYEVTGCEDLRPPDGALMKRTGDDLVIRCNITRETWYLTCRHNKWVGERGNCSAAKPTAGLQRLFGTSIPFPQGLIIAVILGVLLGVIIGTTALCVLLVIRKRRRNRQARNVIVEGPRTALNSDDLDSLQYKYESTSSRKDGGDRNYSSKALTQTSDPSKDGKYSKYIYPGDAPVDVSGNPRTGTGYGRRSHVYETPRVPDESGHDGKVYFELDPDDPKQGGRKPT